MTIFAKVLVVAAAISLWGAGPVAAQELMFASAAEGRAMLSAHDDYMAGMSPFDRASRMQSDHEVSEAEFVQFYASAAMDWTDAEKARLRKAFESIWPAVNSLALPLPDKIYLIRTSGKEEADAAYTRGNAIILPTYMLATSDDELRRLLAHELFHIATRTHPQLAGMLYEAIGFHYCGEAKLPAELEARKISNPDTPRNEYCIQVKIGQEAVWAEPVLLAYPAKYDKTRGGVFFDYLQAGYLLVELRPGESSPRLLYNSGRPRLASERQLTGLFEQIGYNTNYTMQPEEILAENFSLLATGARDVPSPEVLARMKRVLAKFSAAKNGISQAPVH